MKIDLTAPIVPGERAGNISLGTMMSVVLEDNDIEFEKIERETGTVYRSASIDFWVKKSGKIDQVMVHGAYSGKIKDLVGIGRPYEAMSVLGTVDEDEEDNIIIRELPGFCFEYNPNKPHLLTHFCVFPIRDFFTIYPEDDE